MVLFQDWNWCEKRAWSDQSKVRALRAKRAVQLGGWRTRKSQELARLRIVNHSPVGAGIFSSTYICGAIGVACWFIFKIMSEKTEKVKNILQPYDGRRAKKVGGYGNNMMVWYFAFDRPNLIFVPRARTETNACASNRCQNKIQEFWRSKRIFQE